jgi:hypothetical protein
MNIYITWNMEVHMIIPPQEVTAPKAHWNLIDVLVTTEEWSLALGRWDGQLRLACRWNGSEEQPKGNPTSHGNPTWFMLPDEFIDQLDPLIPIEKRSLLHTLFQRSAA